MGWLAVVADLAFFQQQPLDRLNTLRLPARARFFARAFSEPALRYILGSVTAHNFPLYILGGGSNLVLAGALDGLVVQPALMGRELITMQGDTALVRVGAGESWHQTVLWTLQQGWSGLENLALIPGTVGASPIQNIGAYGVEVSDRLHSVRALQISTGDLRTFTADECGFAYRDSIFKSQVAGEYVVIDVLFKLNTKPDLCLDYGDIRGELARQQVSRISPMAVAQAVMAIRSSKLPDPAQLGNAGSFFKNPTVSVEHANSLKQAFPDLVAYPNAQGVKLAAGWLIEHAGWKGYQQGAVAVHDRQALVLVNHGGGTGAELLDLAAKIRASVNAKFAVELEQEPIIWQ
ncbi:MAG: UDP-N-acetylmuramate dehydrogenase [Moraxellaceae bacterium]|nr:UDP-N-acetylmuramate dehydrogenase [Moraxellaceae bacterium]MDP1776610.1 UDP-N-acetylmuramate dehydrogenase [Moraxellaceae bacterium]MDZ4387502.1 UDP-N-acetylmuramate dehydrogenase [Moraxellaceae bacterium]